MRFLQDAVDLPGAGRPRWEEVMTCDEVQSLSGRDLDTEIGLCVMGWYLQAKGRSGTPYWAEFGKAPSEAMVMSAGRWHPSTSVTQAMEAAEKVGVFGEYMGILAMDWDAKRWRVEYHPTVGGPPWASKIVFGSTPAEAISRACLLCVGEGHA
jgi:hypothetical protein